MDRASDFLNPFKKTKINFFKTLITPLLYLLNLIAIAPYIFVFALEVTSRLWHYMMQIWRWIPGVKEIENKFARFIIWLGKRVLKDERDYPLLKTAFLITPVLVFSVVWQLVTPGFSWSLAVLHIVLIFGPRKLDFYFHFFACKHIEAHRLQGLYKKPYGRFLDRYFEWFLGIFYGNIPEMERCAHVGVHHAESNNYSDNLSTLKYDRTSLLDFLKYVFYNSYWHNSGIASLVYFYKNKRPKLLQKNAVGVLFFYSLVVILLLIDWRFCLMYLILPHLIHNCLNAFLNWTWHIFADPNDLNNGCNEGVTLTEDEDDFLYENYHLAHHLNPARHWSENYTHFQENREIYRQKNAMVFKGINLKELFVLTTRGTDLDRLAKHYVDIDRQHSHEEIVKLLRERTRPVIIKAS